MSSKKALIVLGMHRSGTSSIAGALARLGMAAPNNLMPAGADNPRGFWESRVIGDLDDQILIEGGSSWSDWRRFDLDGFSPARLREIRLELEQAVNSEFDDAPQIVLKDPRLCRMLAIWDGVLENLGYEVGFILPIRSPLEVAASLNRRNGMPMSHGVLLWLRHVLDAEFATRGRSRHILTWRAFMSDWRTEVAAIGQSLSVAFEVTDGRASEVDDFLSADLQNEVVPDHRLGETPDGNTWAIEAYEAFKHLSGSPDVEILAELDRLRDVFEQGSGVFGKVYGDLEASLDRAKTSTASELERVKNLEARLERLAGDLERQIQETRVVEASHLEIQRKAELQATALDNERRRANQLDAEVLALRSRARSNIIAILEREDRIAALTR